MQYLCNLCNLFTHYVVLICYFFCRPEDVTPVRDEIYRQNDNLILYF